MLKEDEAEASFIMGIAFESRTFFAVTWDRVKAESLKDLDIKSLVEYIKRGFPDSRSSVPDTVKPFWEIRKHLHCSDGWLCSKTGSSYPSHYGLWFLQHCIQPTRGSHPCFPALKPLFFGLE